MACRFVGVAGSVVALLAMPPSAWSQQPVTVSKMQMRPVASVNGKDLYKAYCEYCHGEDGKGHSPVAASLRVPPGDLTTIAARNGGKFEPGAIEDKINGWKQVPRTMKELSDTADAVKTGVGIENVPVMPAFGPIFAKLYSQEVRDRQIRIANLVRYVKSLQVKATPGEDAPKK